MSPLKKAQLLPIKAQVLSRRKVELFGFDTFFSRVTNEFLIVKWGRATSFIINYSQFIINYFLKGDSHERSCYY